MALRGLQIHHGERELKIVTTKGDLKSTMAKGEFEAPSSGKIRNLPRRRRKAKCTRGVRVGKPDPGQGISVMTKAQVQMHPRHISQETRLAPRYICYNRGAVPNVPEAYELGNPTCAKVYPSQ